MRIAEALKQLPGSPGVYQYFNADGRLLYVGKAKNLKNRVKSYWRMTPSLHPNPDSGARILRMLQEAVTLEYIIVENESDALILENSLIKQLKPKYNILLRDDKTYPYLYIDESKTFPRFELTRKIVNGKKIRYYGPFPSGARALLDALYTLYPLVQKSGSLRGKKACLFHQIGRCPAPCEGRISPEEYRQTVAEATRAVHDLKSIVLKLQNRMHRLAQEERFEEAAAVRDQIDAIERLNLHSDLDLARNDNYDIFAILNGSEKGVVLRLFLRNGRISSSGYSFFRQTDLFDSAEAYRQALLGFYTDETPLTCDTILLAHDLEDRQEVAETLSRRKNTRVKILHPRRGPKARLVHLALKNAEELLKTSREHKTPIEKKIAELFGLDTPPYRIEIFDNSHLMGEAAVGAMTVWNEGKWDKHSYRRYTLKNRDEYGQMREMLLRRIGNFAQEPPPDLWLLDGGETLRRLAVSLLRDAGIHLPVLAIAKEKLDAKAYRAKGAARDLLHGPDGTVELPASDPRLQWLQRLRDEAHRFAVAFHRNRKRRQNTEISLMKQRGIGPATVKKLLDYFGTFEAIAEASAEELSKIVGKKTAERLLQTRKSADS